MDTRPHLFCYILPESLNAEIETFCEHNDVAQASVVRACLRMATNSKTQSQRLVKAAAKDGRKVNGNQKKKLIYLSKDEYLILKQIHKDSQSSMASILRTGIEQHKEKVLKKFSKN